MNAITMSPVSPSDLRGTIMDTMIYYSCFLRPMRLAKHVLVFSLMGAITGCVSVATVGWDKPPAKGFKSGQIYLDKTYYSGANTTVGKHTFTVFAIPVGAIAANRPVDESVNSAIIDALTAAGYEVKPASEAPKGATLLKPTVNKFNYWSYMYLWPFFLDGGGIELDLALSDGIGQRLWSHECSASSFWISPFGAYGFDSAIKSDMNDVVKEITTETMAAKFQNLVNKQNK